MSRQQRTRELFIYMNGCHVGSLVKEPSGSLRFAYSEEWLQSKEANPMSLSMPLTTDTYSGDLVYNYFDNLLPDNVSIRKRIQTRFSAKTNDCFDLLSYIGADCVGALQILTQQVEIDVKKIEAKKIDKKSIATLLKHYQTAPLGMDKNSHFRISIAGAQEKTALLKYKNQWYLPEGATPTSHIIKLPIGFIKHANIDLSESVENEWICLQILSAYGLPVNEATIECFEELKTLVVKRFDRVWDNNKKWLMRLLQEDMCQVSGISSDLKYESDGGPGIMQIMKILQGSHKANDDRKQFMKSVFLFWVLGAIDGHAKNFSVSIESAGRFRLTPLYDVMSAYPLAAKRQLEWKELKMGMSVKSKNTHYHWYNIQLRHWLAMADKCQFPQESMKEIMDEVFDKMEGVIETVEKLLPSQFPAHIFEPIFDGMRKVKSRSMAL